MGKTSWAGFAQEIKGYVSYYKFRNNVKLIIICPNSIPNVNNMYECILKISKIVNNSILTNCKYNFR